MDLNYNYSSPSFCAVQGSAKALVNRLHEKAAKLVMEQAYNNQGV